MSAQTQIGTAKVDEIGTVVRTVHGSLGEAPQRIPVVFLRKLGAAEGLECADIVGIFVKERLTQRLGSVEISRLAMLLGLGKPAGRVLGTDRSLPRTDAGWNVTLHRLLLRRRPRDAPSRGL